jgi:hypothetical protein
MTDATSLVIALGTGPTDGATVAALRLADAATQRGLDVTVFAYGEAVRVGAAGCPTSSYVRGLVGTGGEAAGGAPVPEATWIIDAHDPRTSPQVPGVVRGDGSDLWRAVRAGDVVLGVTA